MVASGAQASEVVTPGGACVVERATATSTVTLPKPSGVVNGNALVATFTADNLPTATAPAGWTQIVAPQSIGSGARLFSYLHVVTDAAAEPAFYTWGLSSSQKWGGTLAAFHNVDPVNPLDTTVATVTDATYTRSTLTVPAVTTQTAGAMVVSGVGADRRDATFALSSGTVIAQAHDGQGTALARRDALTVPGSSPAAAWSMAAGTAAAGWVTALRPAPAAANTPAAATITGTTTGDGTVTVDFAVDPGTDNVTGVQVCRDGTDTTGGGPWCGTLAAGATSVTFDKLVNGTAYTFTVDPVVDGVPSGHPASATATPAGGTQPPPEDTRLADAQAATQAALNALTSNPADLPTASNRLGEAKAGVDDLIANPPAGEDPPPPPANKPPTVNAGTDQSITLPATAALNGTVTDDDLPSVVTHLVEELRAGDGHVRQPGGCGHHGDVLRGW